MVANPAREDRGPRSSIDSSLDLRLRNKRGDEKFQPATASRRPSEIHVMNDVILFQPGSLGGSVNVADNSSTTGEPPRFLLGQKFQAYPLSYFGTRYNAIGKEYVLETVRFITFNDFRIQVNGQSLQLSLGSQYRCKALPADDNKSLDHRSSVGSTKFWQKGVVLGVQYRKIGD